jgi:hypothetical protein
MPYKSKEMKRKADARYRARKKADDSNYLKHVAQTQKSYRQRLKDHQTPQKARIQRRKKREYMRSFRSQRKRNAKVECEGTLQPQTVEVIDLDVMECPPAVSIGLGCSQAMSSSSLPDISSCDILNCEHVSRKSLSAQKREKLKALKVKKVLVQENRKLNQSIWRLEKRLSRIKVRIIIIFYNTIFAMYDGMNISDSYSQLQEKLATKCFPISWKHFRKKINRDIIPFLYCRRYIVILKNTFTCTLTRRLYFFLDV